jgi:hypothetical protein
MGKGPDLISAYLFNPSQLNDGRWRIVATPDLSRDGRANLLFQHEDGTLAVWYMNGIDLHQATWPFRSSAESGNGGRFEQEVTETTEDQEDQLSTINPNFSPSWGLKSVIRFRSKFSVSVCSVSSC